MVLRLCVRRCFAGIGVVSGVLQGSMGCTSSKKTDGKGGGKEGGGAVGKGTGGKTIKQQGNN